MEGASAAVKEGLPTSMLYRQRKQVVGSLTASQHVICVEREADQREYTPPSEIHCTLTTGANWIGVPWALHATMVLHNKSYADIVDRSEAPELRYSKPVSAGRVGVDARIRCTSDIIDTYELYIQETAVETHMHENVLDNMFLDLKYSDEQQRGAPLQMRMFGPRCGDVAQWWFGYNPSGIAVWQPNQTSDAGFTAIGDPVDTETYKNVNDRQVIQHASCFKDTSIGCSLNNRYAITNWKEEAQLYGILPRNDTTQVPVGSAYIDPMGRTIPTGQTMEIAYYFDSYGGTPKIWRNVTINLPSGKVKPDIICRFFNAQLASSIEADANGLTQFIELQYDPHTDRFYIEELTSSIDGAATAARPSQLWLRGTDQTLTVAGFQFSASVTPVPVVNDNQVGGKYLGFGVNLQDIRLSGKIVGDRIPYAPFNAPSRAGTYTSGLADADSFARTTLLRGTPFLNGPGLYITGDRSRTSAEYNANYVLPNVKGENYLVHYFRMSSYIGGQATKMLLLYMLRESMIYVSLKLANPERALALRHFTTSGTAKEVTTIKSDYSIKNFRIHQFLMVMDESTLSIIERGNPAGVSYSVEHFATMANTIAGQQSSGSSIINTQAGCVLTILSRPLRYYNNSQGAQFLFSSCVSTKPVELGARGYCRWWYTLEAYQYPTTGRINTPERQFYYAAALAMQCLDRHGMTSRGYNMPAVAYYPKQDAIDTFGPYYDGQAQPQQQCFFTAVDTSFGMWHEDKNGAYAGLNMATVVPGYLQWDSNCFEPAQLNSVPDVFNEQRFDVCGGPADVNGNDFLPNATIIHMVRAQAVFTITSSGSAGVTF